MSTEAVLYAYGKAASDTFRSRGVTAESVLRNAERSHDDRVKIAAVAVVYAELRDAENAKVAVFAGVGSMLADAFTRPLQGAASFASRGADALGATAANMSEPSLASRAVDLLSGTDLGTRARSAVSDAASWASDALSGAANKANDVADDVTRLGVKTDAQRFEEARPHLPHWMMNQHLEANDFNARPLTPYEMPAQITSRDIAQRVNQFIRDRGLTRLSDFLQQKIDTHLPAWKAPVRPFYVDGPDGKRFRVVLDD